MIHIIKIILVAPLAWATIIIMTLYALLLWDAWYLDKVNEILSRMFEK